MLNRIKRKEKKFSTLARVIQRIEQKYKTAAQKTYDYALN